MPEGDTIHKAAARLRPALEGQVLRGFRAPRMRGMKPRPGTLIDAVRAQGKNLVVDFDDGLSLRVHLQMSGSWHLYRRGQRWQRPLHEARAVLEVDDWVAVAFLAPTVETFARASGATALDHLGPDLCDPGADLNTALERFAAVPEPDTEVAVALLDQRIASGIGNVYKSEVLWQVGVDPFAPVSAIDEVTRLKILTTAARLLQANLGTARRVTHPLGHAVYGRARRPCPRCETPVASIRQGEQARTTFWCPRCQSPGSSDRGGGAEQPA